MGGVIYQKRFLGTVGNGLCAVPQMQRIDHRTPANPQEPTTCHCEGRRPVAISWQNVRRRTKYQEIAASLRSSR